MTSRDGLSMQFLGAVVMFQLEPKEKVMEAAMMTNVELAAAIDYAFCRVNPPSYFFDTHASVDPRSIELMRYHLEALLAVQLARAEEVN